MNTFTFEGVFFFGMSFLELYKEIKAEKYTLVKVKHIFNHVFMIPVTLQAYRKNTRGIWCRFEFYNH